MEEDKKITLPNIISTAIQIPGVKVNRADFLRDIFKKKTSEEIELIVKQGTIEFGCKRKELKDIAEKIVYKRTMVSTTASFLAGLPGGIAMAATIPADLLQFYGNVLGLAQELAYLYGEEDLWSGNELDDEKVKNQLILYCGVMLGSAGASQAVRVLSSSLAQRLLKQLPQKALTKGFIYPIIKSIAKFFGLKMTKDIFAKGVSKVVPIMGGVVSGGLTFVTLKPMGQKLINAFDESKFDYSEENFEDDWKDIVDICEAENEEVDEDKVISDVAETKEEKSKDVIGEIKKAKLLLDEGIITEEEFSKIKEKLIKKI